MDRRLSDEQLDRAIIRLLAEQGGEIVASGVTPAKAAARVRLGSSTPAGLTNRPATPSKGGVGIHRPTLRTRSQTMNTTLKVAAVAVLTLAVGVAVFELRPDTDQIGSAPAPSPSPGPLVWSPASMEQDWPAPVRAEPVGDPVIVPLAGGYTDPSGDIESSDVPWVDIQSVTAGNVRAGNRKGRVLVEVVAFPPSPFGDSNEPWIAYGLVFDTDLDGVADVRLGMDRVRAELTQWDSSGPCPASSGSSGSLVASRGEPSPLSSASVCSGTGGDRVRAWRTDLRTGTTEYGEAEFTVCDCSFPGMNSSDRGTAYIYPHQAIPGRFYGWASVIQDGRVVATDYAPDSGWLDSMGSIPAGTPSASPSQ